MTEDDKPRYVDTMEMTDTETQVYESIITLEYLGRATTRTEIAATAGLDDQTLDAGLAALTERGALVQSQSGDEAAFEPARRDWSTKPDRPSPAPLTWWNKSLRRKCKP